jgi:plasmid stabilization system protein ParE
MAKLEYSLNALSDIKRLVAFLLDSDVIAALETFDIINEAIQILKRHPDIGHATSVVSNRKLVISRGKTGYIAAYKFDKLTDIVVILAIKHQRESRFN